MECQPGGWAGGLLTFGLITIGIQGIWDDVQFSSVQIWDDGV